MLHYAIKGNRESQHIETSLRGKQLLTTPLLNKGTAFTDSERAALGLLGKLPEQVESLADQVLRARQQFERYTHDLERYIYLNSLHDKNEILFYKLISEDLKTFLPKIYTPGVGSAVEAYSREFRQPRGLYISYPNLKHLDEMLSNRTHPDIQLVVMTDGEGVLGIGDQGIGGMDIVIAKLVVYSLCGVNPYHTLPMMLDVGTNNEALLNDPMYLGWRHERLEGQAYLDFMDQVISTLSKHFPKAFLHFEDFGRQNASQLLTLHRENHCVFNDDIQGTGVVTLSAINAAVSQTELPLTEHRVMIYGSGSAGIGVADQIKAAMMRGGLSEQEALNQFYLIDRDGLLVEGASTLTDTQTPYARHQDDAVLAKIQDMTNLQALVQAIQPTILIGCSACFGAFTKEAITAMAAYAKRPIIFPLSNPNTKSEAAPADLIQWTDGRALVATGSPFGQIVQRGAVRQIGQCNNAFAFPGIGLGVMLTKATCVNDQMLMAASDALTALAPIQTDETLGLLPLLSDIPEVSQAIAKAVALAAIESGVARQVPDDIEQALLEARWNPEYLPIKASPTL